MRVYTSAMFALVAVALGAAPAGAQGSGSVEVTPYVAIGSYRASPVGAAVVFPVTSSLSVETDVAYRRGEGDIHALSTTASLLWSLPRVGQVTPYLGAGVGLAQFGAPILSRSGSWVGTQPRVALTMNAGGGFKMPINDRVALRTDARWLKSFGAHGSEEYRVAQGVSLHVGKR